MPGSKKTVQALRRKTLKQYITSGESYGYSPGQSNILDVEEQALAHTDIEDAENMPTRTNAQRNARQRRLAEVRADARRGVYRTQAKADLDNARTRYRETKATAGAAKKQRIGRAKKKKSKKAQK